MVVPQFTPFVGPEEFLGIEECFSRSWISEGPKAEAFVTQLKEILGTPYAVLAPNGTLALYLALRALGIGAGDEVIVPDFTFIAPANAIEMAGAIPIFVDVVEGTLQIDLSKADRLVTARTKAVMPVAIFGSTPDYGCLETFAKRHRLAVIEDACEAFAVTFRGKCAGTVGDAGCFSFFADKTITTGEGGLVVTAREDIYQKLLYLRNQGRIKRGSFVHPEIGYNFRMTDIQCAVGLVQLGKLPEILQRKSEILRRYQTGLATVAEVQFTKVEPGSEYIPFRTTIFAERAHELMAFLTQRGVETRTFFFPLHKQPCFQSLAQYSHPVLKLDDSEFPVTTDAYARGVCLPAYPALSAGEIDYVCEQIAAFYLG